MVIFMKTKIFKISLFYFSLCLLLYKFYDSHLMSQIVFHYTSLDIHYLFFVGVQYFWIHLFYQIIYQYISLYTMMRIRISQKECFYFLMKKFILYGLFYIFINCFIFFIFFHHISLYLLLLNLSIQYLSICFMMIFHKYDKYSYLFIIIFILCCHFVV